MRINNSALQSNGLLNILRGGQNKGAEKGTGETKNGENNASSMLDSLMDRKQTVTDMKNELIGKTLENGGELADIKPQIEAYEEQLQLIDEEITQTMSKQAEEVTGKKDTDKTDEVTTQQELTEKKNRDVLTLSGSMEQIKILASVKTKMENQGNTWSSEIKKDGLHASDLKKENLSELKCRISSVNQEMMGTITDTNQSSNQSNDVVAVQEETEAPEDSEKEENAEKIQAGYGLDEKFILASQGVYDGK